MGVIGSMVTGRSKNKTKSNWTRRSYSTMFTSSEKNEVGRGVHGDQRRSFGRIEVKEEARGAM